MRPRLKDVAWERDGDRLRVVYDLRNQFVLPDPDGGVQTLLELLAAGGRTTAELARALASRGREVSIQEISEALDLLDDSRLLEDDDRRGFLEAADQERYFSNLAFFESFATLSRSREDFQRDLAQSHVLVLGTGGLNSSTIPHLCGLGVGRLTVVDRDTVQPRNFARQYLYQWRDIGSEKVAQAAQWVRAFDPSIKVEAVQTDVGGADDIAELIDRFAPDVVMSGIDKPEGIDNWVNAACVSRNVPFVRAGMLVTTGKVWSVDPWSSACRACALVDMELTADEQAATTLYAEKERVNRGIGPVAGLLGSLSAFEVARYLTRFEEPVYAGRPLLIDFADGCASRLAEWLRAESCPVCGNAARGTVTTG